MGTDGKPGVMGRGTIGNRRHILVLTLDLPVRIPARSFPDKIKIKTESNPAGVIWILRLAMPGGRGIFFGQQDNNLMADAANRYSENVAGKYYVDNQCIDCDLCRETAPDNYKRNDDGGYSYVYKQPETPEEEARCKEAKEGCPVEAIGDNGA
jgi:ferredoxin